MHYKRGVNLETGELYLNKLYLYTVSILITINSDSENVVYDPFFRQWVLTAPNMPNSGKVKDEIEGIQIQRRSRNAVLISRRSSRTTVNP